MSDSKLHLMSFAPVPDTKTTVHVVGLPDSLRDALFTLMPPRKEGGYLNTKVLKDDLRCWLDRAVELNPVRPNVHTDSWLIALAPIDLAKLCNVIAVWISSRKDIDTQSPAYRKVMGMLHPETFEEAVRGEEICLFSGDGRPTGRLTFPAFSAQVADAIADIPLELANGMVENFSRVSRGNGNVYELISDIHWHKEDPWAFALRFHVETLPVGRKARLNMDVAVRRFIGKPWQDDPFLKHDVNAYVRTEGGTLRVVPYGYDKQKRDLAWDPAALANYEFASGTGLPAVREYLEDMGRYARDGSQPQILSPYAMTASWASKPSVASGASVIDKAMFFEAVAARLKDIAEPVGALDSLQLTHLKASIEEPRQADWDKDPVSARARQETWGRANRARLAHCTGRDRAVFQLIGNQDDARLLDMARAEISRFLGGEGAVDGFEVEIDNIPANDLLNRMENTGDSQAKIRWRKVAAALPEATDPTACIVVLPGAESYKPKGKDDGGDPKRALRIAFAKTGRLTQFIEPEDSKDSPEIRARVAVRGLMRQLGFVPEPARNSRGIDTSIPAIGLKVYNSGNGKARASFPYCVRQDMRSGAVTVYCPLLPDGSLPYWRALIEFARLSGSEGFPDSCKRANGMALKRMLHGIVRATGDRPELLLVNSYGRIRQRDWWPGISDSGLESGPLSYGPTGYEEPLGLAGSKLRILRIRSGLNGEVPDWFTDEVAAGGADDGTVPNRRDKQGLFKMDGYFLALAPRPGDAQYKWSARGSKYDSPTAAFCEKTINEYCLLSPGGEAEALASVKYAEALRGCMVQLYKNDMRVNLPAPLHLAEQVEEYIWDWELTGRR